MWKGVGNDEKVKDIRKRAIQAGLRLVDCPIRHLGTERRKEIYLAIQNYLLDNGVKILFGHACENLLLDGDHCRGVLVCKAGKKDECFSFFSPHHRDRDRAQGRGLAGTAMRRVNDIAHQPGTVDIGVRVEVRNEIMEYVNNVLYESNSSGT